MALLVAEGFDHYSSAALMALKPTFAGISHVTPNQTGRFPGSKAVLMSAASFTGSFQLFLPSTYATLFCGMAWQPSATPGVDFLTFRVGSTTTARLSVNASNQLQVRNSGGTVIATGTTTILSNIWHYIELKIFINGASGTCEVHLNGVTEIASTVGNFGSSNLDNVLVSGTSSSGSAGLVDDVYVCDTSGSTNNNFLGDTQVQTFYPDAAGAHTDFNASAGFNWQNVDDASPDDDTTYNFSSTVGSIDSFGINASLDPGATVYGVQVTCYVRKDNTGTRTAAPVVRQSSTDYVGSTSTLGTNYTFFTQIYNQDPTGSNWTATNVNADEFGYKLVA